MKRIILGLIGFIFLISLVSAACPSSFPPGFTCDSETDGSFVVSDGEDLFCEYNDESNKKQWYICDGSGSCQWSSVDVNDCYNEDKEKVCCPYLNQECNVGTGKCEYTVQSNLCSMLDEQACNAADDQTAANEYELYNPDELHACGDNWDSPDYCFSKNCFCEWKTNRCEAKAVITDVCDNNNIIGSCSIFGVLTGSCDEGGVSEIPITWTAVRNLNYEGTCDSGFGAYSCERSTLSFFNWINIIAVIVIIVIVYYLYSKNKRIVRKKKR